MDPGAYPRFAGPDHHGSDGVDDQIEKFFLGVSEEIYRIMSGADLIAKLNQVNPWLMCSLIHKFGGKDDETADPDVDSYLAELRKFMPKGFRAERKYLCLYRRMSPDSVRGSARCNEKIPTRCHVHRVHRNPLIENG